MRSIVVTEQGATIRADGKFLVVEQRGQTLKKLRLHDVDQLMVMGNVTLTPGAVALVARSEIDTVFLTVRGSYRARLLTRTSKNIVLRSRQWERSSEAEFVTGVVQRIVRGKLTSQRQLLLRAQRQLKDDDLAETLGRMRVIIDRLDRTEAVDSLRGLEGAGSALYFGQFGKLLKNEVFTFSGRNRRPPRDPVNAMLSFTYALLLNTVETEVMRCGLDPLRGFFHEPAHGRPSLVLDIMEEFRPSMDQLVVRLINRRQLGRGDFDYRSGQSLEAILADSAAGSGDEEPADPTGTAVYLGDTGRKIVLAAYYQRLRNPMYYPIRGKRLEFRQIIREQCYHLARVVEGKDRSYEPFVPR